jgi:hypothetical protein
MTLEAYENETTEIVTSFLRHKISFPECIESLNAAFERYIPEMTGEHITRLRIVVLANNEIVMKEMEKRVGSGPL